jgi:DNA polymerase III epsilon subunit-like protein
MGISYRIDARFQIIDTMKLSRKQYPGQRASIDALAARVGVSLREREQAGFHGALIDSRITGHIFLAMTAGQASFGYSDGRQPVAAITAKLDRRRWGPLRVVRATPDEEGAHARLCDVIEKASGGCCGFRGKWSTPEKSPDTGLLKSVPEFGSGAASPAERSPSSPDLKQTLMASTEAGAPTDASAFARPRNVSAVEIDFSPSV